METKIVGFDAEELIEAIRKRKVVAFPTETVYGLGVIADFPYAYENLVEIKKRRPDKPFTLMLSSAEEIGKYAVIDEKTKRIIDEFMPGEITLLLPPKEGVASWIRLDSPYIGVRVSGSREVSRMIARVGAPMLVTSANLSGEKTCADFESTEAVFSGKVPFIVKGETFSRLPSTIVIAESKLTLVRQGSIPFEEIEKVWRTD